MRLIVLCLLFLLNKACRDKAYDEASYTENNYAKFKELIESDFLESSMIESKVLNDSTLTSFTYPYPEYSPVYGLIFSRYRDSLDENILNEKKEFYSKQAIESYRVLDTCNFYLAKEWNNLDCSSNREPVPYIKDLFHRSQFIKAGVADFDSIYIIRNKRGKLIKNMDLDKSNQPHGFTEGVVTGDENLLYFLLVY